MNDKTNYGYPLFSVAMCVYEKDNAEWFDTALKSIIYQTVKPQEIVLVVDGPISENIQKVIEKNSILCTEESIFLKIFRLPKNRGHGEARKRGIAHCENNIVALMDADDICCPNRFEDEIKEMVITNADIVGGDISEFIDSEDHPISYRRVPRLDEEIKKYMKRRCPFNQVTVMFRKESYIKAGGYMDWYCDEDYYLWLRMQQHAAVFANTGTVLVNVRVGEAMYRRRGGWKYFRSEAKLQTYMLKEKIIGLPRYWINILERFVVQILMPNCIRGWAFKTLFRQKTSSFQKEKNS